MKFELELLEPRSHRVPEAPRVGLVLEAGHDVIGVAILSSSAAIPSGRCLWVPGLGMYLRRTGSARYVPRWTR